MKKILIPVVGLLFILVTACNNSDKKNDSPVAAAPKTTADSLMADVMEGHNVGMAKMSKINNMKKEVQRVLDSITKLPAKAQQAAAPYKAKLDAVSKDLTDAGAAMDKWMEEFNMDSAINNMEQRINYLAEEKMKVGKVKEAILNNLQKADSLLKSKL